MRLFRRRSPTDLDPQLTGLRFEPQVSGSGPDEEKSNSDQQNSDFLNYEGITPKSARKMSVASSGGKNFDFDFLSFFSIIVINVLCFDLVV